MQTLRLRRPAFEFLPLPYVLMGSERLTTGQTFSCAALFVGALYTWRAKMFRGGISSICAETLRAPICPFGRAMSAIFGVLMIGSAIVIVVGVHAALVSADSPCTGDDTGIRRSRGRRTPPAPLIPHTVFRGGRFGDVAPRSRSERAMSFSDLDTSSPSCLSRFSIRCSTSRCRWRIAMMRSRISVARSADPCRREPSCAPQPKSPQSPQN